MEVRAELKSARFDFPIVKVSCCLHGLRIAASDGSAVNRAKANPSLLVRAGGKLLKVVLHG